MYEGQLRFDVIYGTVTNGNTSATAGVQRDNTFFTQYSATAPVAAATGGQSYFYIRHPAQVLRHLPLRTQQLHSRQRLQQRSYSYRDSNRYSYTNSYSHPHANSHANGDCNGNVHATATPQRQLPPSRQQRQPQPRLLPLLLLLLLLRLQPPQHPPHSNA